MANTARSWADVSVGSFNIPTDATHFRWANATAQRQKMCDGGRLYDLSDPHDRPTTRPTGAVRVYPYTVAQGKEGREDVVTPITCKPGIGGNDPITYVVIEFENQSNGNAEVVDSLLRMLDKSVALNNKPSEILIEENKRLRAENDEQKEYIAANEGGPVSRFLNQHPEIVQDLVKAGLEWGHILGRGLKIRVLMLEEEAKAKGVIDVTPKN